MGSTDTLQDHNQVKPAHKEVEWKSANRNREASMTVVTYVRYHDSLST